ncbi:Ger(x)C family spore germination protein [Clostridium sp. 19966]|uniref:Ger(x)C family spore germination protein n=1 Tax=Clostridium sp. 19966 TaxID=2768166 RepID=UPI0028DE26D9|nr:Ger(x)C family spore germination protein [Clostridium sp. 19966]MDT8716898.1 Ger(x)C family spore germination protein [Clostridium sp. 19966]
MRKIISVLLIFTVSCGLFSGCYDKREIDDQTYVIAIGMDKGTVQPLKLTLQYAMTQSVGGGSSGGGSSSGGGNKVLSSVTIDTETFNSGITAANGFIGKRINMSHAIVLVISKELAKEGISKYIYGLSRERHYRPSMFVAVARGSAEGYLNSINPLQEVDPSKYYQLLFNAYKFTGYTANTQFFNFYTHMTALDMQAVAVLAGVSRYQNSDEFKSKYSTYKKKNKIHPSEGDFKAGDIPENNAEKGEIMGLAMFNGDKMIGELDGDETESYLMVTGEFHQSYVSVPDPKFPQESVLLRIEKRKKPKYKTKFINGKSEISIDIKLEGDFVSIQSGYNYENSKNFSIIENAASELISKRINETLNKTAKDYNCDIFGFGKSVKKIFLTNKKWEEFKWLDKYKASSFTVNVDLKLRRTGLIIRTSPTPIAEGGESSKNESSEDN